MVNKIFVNLPVQDLQKSIAFFTHLGFTFNPQFTDETATCMIMSDTIYAMLLTHPKFAQFTKKAISDAHKTTEVLMAIELPSREAVDTMGKKALESGATTYADPQDYGWMYQHSFAALDGHQWEVMFLDATAIPQNP